VEQSISPNVMLAVVLNPLWLAFITTAFVNTDKHFTSQPWLLLLLLQLITAVILFGNFTNTN